MPSQCLGPLVRYSLRRSVLRVEGKERPDVVVRELASDLGHAVILARSPSDRREARADSVTAAFENALSR